MLISVIMANYNGERYLGEAIESVLMQTYQDFEFIIVEDASTDGSRKVIENYHRLDEDRIKPIYGHENRGQGACFNIGVQLSKGNVICFLDSDDLWFKNKLENVYHAFQSKDKFSFHQHNLYLIRGDAQTNQKFRNIMVAGDLFTVTLEKRYPPSFSPTSGLSFSRDTIDKVTPIPDAFVTCADGYLTRTGICHGEVAADNDCWGAYRIHASNCTFDNPTHNNRRYIDTILIPHLNRYYQKNNVGLWFPTNLAGKFYYFSARKMLRKLLRESRIHRIDSLLQNLIH